MAKNKKKNKKYVKGKRNRKSEPTVRWWLLPNEVWLHIFWYCDLLAMARLPRVCPRFQDISRGMKEINTKIQDTIDAWNYLDKDVGSDILKDISWSLTGKTPECGHMSLISFQESLLNDALTTLAKTGNEKYLYWVNQACFTTLNVKYVATSSKKPKLQYELFCRQCRMEQSGGYGVMTSDVVDPGETFCPRCILKEIGKLPADMVEKLVPFLIGRKELVLYNSFVDIMNAKGLLSLCYTLVESSTRKDSLADFISQAKRQLIFDEMTKLALKKETQPSYSGAEPLGNHLGYRSSVARNVVMLNRDRGVYEVGLQFDPVISNRN